MCINCIVNNDVVENFRLLVYYTRVSHLFSVIVMTECRIMMTVSFRLFYLEAEYCFRGKNNTLKFLNESIDFADYTEKDKSMASLLIMCS